MTIFKKRTEEQIVDVEFNTHKFSQRLKPDNPDKILIISCFSEFGCEVVGALYCISRIIKEHPGMYVIVMGWYGRSYLYKHLVDEFWELKESYQWLRDFALAFHHKSINLKRIEKTVCSLGTVVPAEALGRIAVGNLCNTCHNFWGQIEKVEFCPKCNSKDLTKSLFSDVAYWRQMAQPIPPPSAEKMALAKQYIGPNSVGVIARNRTTYGRNLQPEFYVKLLHLLEDLGYWPIWLGEKQSTLACPLSGIVDMSRKEEARDLELTLAIVSQLKLTVQFWTASTRLAAITKVPYLVFESPDQLFGAGQEAYRLALCTTGKAKIVLSHFLNVYNDNDMAIKLVQRSIREMANDDWRLTIGMVDAPEVVWRMRQQNMARLGDLC